MISFEISDEVNIFLNSYAYYSSTYMLPREGVDIVVVFEKEHIILLISLNQVEFTHQTHNLPSEVSFSVETPSHP